MAAQYRTTAPPALEPVTVDDAKRHARIFYNDDDAYVASLVVAAREKLEASVCRSFVTRGVEAVLDGFPTQPRGTRPIPSDYGDWYRRNSRSLSLPIRLLYPPLQSVSSITYLDVDGVSRTLDAAAYSVLPGTPGAIVPAPGASWPATLDRTGSVVVAFTAGDGQPADVPEVAKLVIKILVAHWYDRREPVASGSIAPVPFMVDALSDSLRWGDYP